MELSPGHRATRPPRTISVLVLVLAVALVAIVSTWVAWPTHPRSAAPRRSPAAASSQPDSFVTVLSTGAPSALLPVGFVSLSVEAADISNGTFTADRPGLIPPLKALHLGFLRIGANTGDTAPLTARDLANVAILAKAVAMPVVLELPLVRDEPANAAAEAAAATRLLGRSLRAVEIGNESDAYAREHERRRPWTYRQYASERNAYLRAFTRAGVRTALWGPDTAGPAFLRSAAAEPGVPYQVLTPHFYPLSRCSGPRPTVRELLSDNVRAEEIGAATRFTLAAHTAHRPVVVGESNSVACGGAAGVSNSAASALWTVDYGLTMARAGLSGIAFHVPLKTCAGYSPLCLRGHGRSARWQPNPEYAGLLDLVQLEGQRFTQEALHSIHHHLRAYTLTSLTNAPTLVILDLDPANRGLATIRWLPHASLTATVLTTTATNAGYLGLRQPVVRTTRLSELPGGPTRWPPPRLSPGTMDIISNQASPSS